MTPQEVMDRTSFPEVAALDDGKLTGYIERAESWIRRATGRKFREETDPDVLSDLRTATVLLVEYLWYHDHPDVREGVLSQVESEKIGSYSYKVSGAGDTIQEMEFQATHTGIQELDSILESLKVQPVQGALFFSISGPSRVKKCNEI
ncbi:head-tail connector protein [Aneurinibacillus thermoaerophilus]|uniref:head-tail connector protein n=1 Tax=Aneurinibacillus thermoaerophilus TaxID=143495 RepID=UPI002E23BC92|nr:head-tail connector protein [Aneurinibacillus thermoaerophilus]MED0739017.1 head-tail connector protein [Aneurinibacillus thermoaerophilus]MED0765997.1 head-tail connector protein [Aneurinibacillus thermoaerophilus]